MEIIANENMTKESKNQNNNKKHNINSKYENALLEELNNNKLISWRNDITNVAQEELNINNKINNNKIISNKEKENIDINKDDRFKDFDEILLLEENKDKKKKNRFNKINLNEKVTSIPKPNEKINFENNINKKMIQDNHNSLNKNSSTISELNKCFENNSGNIENKENNSNNKNLEKNENNNIIILNEINESINNTDEKNDNKLRSINLEYSDDKKSIEENEDKNIIKGKAENSKDNKIITDKYYNNFIDIFDRYNSKNKNIMNKNLKENNNSKKSTYINNNRNRYLKMSKSHNVKNIKEFQDNIINSNKSQNLRRNLIYDKNTINIQLSIKRKSRSAKDIKKHMSYYLMENKNNITKLINEYPSKRNSDSNRVSLNSFLPFQISCNQINSKNNFNDINSPINIFKNPLTEKIKKKINNININTYKKYRTNKITTKKNYQKFINLEFFEESKQDNFYGNVSKAHKKSKNNSIDNKLLFPESKTFRTNDNTNNYLFKTYSTNFNNKRNFLFYSKEPKRSDFFNENKNEILGINFNSKNNYISKNFTYNNIKTSNSFTSIFQNKEKYSFLNTHDLFLRKDYNDNNYRNSLLRKKNDIFSIKFFN